VVNTMPCMCSAGLHGLCGRPAQLMMCLQAQRRVFASLPAPDSAAARAYAPAAAECNRAGIALATQGASDTSHEALIACMIALGVIAGFVVVVLLATWPLYGPYVRARCAGKRGPLPLVRPSRAPAAPAQPCLHTAALNCSLRVRRTLQWCTSCRIQVTACQHHRHQTAYQTQLAQLKLTVTYANQALCACSASTPQMTCATSCGGSTRSRRCTQRRAARAPRRRSVATGRPALARAAWRWGRSS
jgi:hypothetical protein